MTMLLFASLAAAAVLAQNPPALNLRVGMIALGVSDMPRSTRFYSETLRLPVIGKPDPDITLVRAGEVTIVLSVPLGRSAKPSAAAVEVIFPVDSVSAARAELGARGCVFVAEPHEVSPGMWAATFTDPDGHQLTVFGGK